MRGCAPSVQAARRRRTAPTSARLEPREDAGTAAPVGSPDKKREPWSKIAEAWFLDGVDDPDLALVRVRIHQVSYWYVKRSQFVQLLLMARTVVTGTRASFGELGVRFSRRPAARRRPTG
jgi:hypothetical protein